MSGSDRFSKPGSLGAVPTTTHGIVLAALLLISAQASAQTPALLPLDQVRPGQKGYGLTVFSGFTIERFDVQVIDVLPGFLPKQDLFLVRLDHPVTRETGVVGGMSGSPILLDGKLAGALSYGWRFSKEPVAGITPIASMMDLLRRPLRGPEVPGPSPSADARRTLDRMALQALSRRDRWWRPSWLTPVPEPEAQLVPVSVPLHAAGFSREAMALLSEGFASFGFEPVQGGGTGRTEGPTAFEPGGSLGVQLVSGDMSLSSTGTVTWVDRGKVLGFGHRLFNAGELNLPATTSKVVHTLASQNRSFKIAVPARTVGALLQDRQAGVLVDSGQTVGTIPVQIRMSAPGYQNDYRLRLAHHRLLTPNLLRTVVQSALGEAIPDAGHATYTLSTRLAVKGYPPVKLVEDHYSPGGVPMSLSVMAQGLRAVGKIMQNPFAGVTLERIDIDIAVRHAHEMEEIVGLRLSANRARPGEKLTATVTFKPFNRAEYEKDYPLDIPGDIDGSLLVLEASAGSLVKPEQAVPETLSQLLSSLEETFPARSLVLSLRLPGQGVKLRGRVIPDLPLSVLDSLSVGTQTRTEAVFSTVRHQPFPHGRVLAGKRSLRLRVQSDPR